MLEDKLLLAEKYNIHPNDMRVLIEEKPVIDTANESDKHAMQMANWSVAKDDYIKVDEIKNANRVMYWKTSEEAHSVMVAGIAWAKDDTACFFKAEILNP